MGHDAVQVYVAANLSELPCRAYRVLLRMALVIRDEESEPGADDAYLYFGGWKAFTNCLGYGITHEDDDIPDAAERTIARAISDLRRAGLIENAPKKKRVGHWGRVYYLPPLPSRYYT